MLRWWLTSGEMSGEMVQMSQCSPTQSILKYFFLFALELFTVPASHVNHATDNLLCLLLLVVHVCQSTLATANEEMIRLQLASYCLAGKF